MDTMIKKNYQKPNSKVIELGIISAVLIGSNEGGEVEEGGDAVKGHRRGFSWEDDEEY